MRKIKFNAWYKSESGDQYNEMCTWERLQNMNPQRPSRVFHDIISGSDNRFTLLQFTGLLDENNREIYDADIVHFVCGNKDCNYRHTGVVIWINELASWGISEDGISEFPLQVPDENGDLGLLSIKQVIGNKFENPELAFKPAKK